MSREFYVFIERDEDGYYVGEVPQLSACFAQGKTMDELLTNMREVIALALEDQEIPDSNEFYGIQKLVLDV